jgi:glycosyltransferase involved in cell wall biosynthesis
MARPYCVLVSLVTIGIPTYNRAASLERAVRSALQQDHPELEVLVSDDASPDPNVGVVISRLTAADPRVRAIRQERNLGHAANYQCVLAAARGKYFMWLADDDWIEPEYVSRCLTALTADAATMLVCGLGRYYVGGRHVIDERPINLESLRPGARIVRYFSRVSLNGPLFGLARHSDLLTLGFPQDIGGDWLLVAGLAARGRVRTLADVHIHRAMDGLGADASRLAHSFGISGLAARQHHMFLAVRLAREVSFGAWAPQGMNCMSRATLAAAVASLIMTRFVLVDLVRTMLGARIASSIERRISNWLRVRESK